MKKYLFLIFTFTSLIFILSGCSGSKTIKKAEQLLDKSVIINEHLSVDNVPSNYLLAKGSKDLRSEIEELLPKAKKDKKYLAQLKTLVDNIALDKGKAKLDSNLVLVQMTSFKGTNFYFTLNNEAKPLLGHEFLLSKGSSGSLKVIAAPSYNLVDVLLNNKKLDQVLSTDKDEIIVNSLTINEASKIKATQQLIDKKIKLSFLGNILDQFTFTDLNGKTPNFNELVINTRLLVKPKDNKDSILYLNGEKGIKIKATGSVINISKELYISAVNVTDVMNQMAIALLPSTLYSLDIPVDKVSKEIGILRIDPSKSIEIISEAQNIYNELKSMTSGFPADKFEKLANLVKKLEFGTSEEKQYVITFTNTNNYNILSDVAQYDLAKGKKLLYHPSYFNQDTKEFTFRLFSKTGHKIDSINYQDYGLKTVKNKYDEIIITKEQETSNETSTINKFIKLDCSNHTFCNVSVLEDNNEYQLSAENDDVKSLIPNSISIYHITSNGSEELWSPEKKYLCGSIFKVKKTEKNDRRIIVFRKELTTIHFEKNNELLFSIDSDTKFFSEAQEAKFLYVNNEKLINNVKPSNTITLSNKKYDGNLEYNIYNKNSKLEAKIKLPQFYELEELSLYNKEDNTEKIYYGSSILPEYSEVKDISKDVLTTPEQVSYRVYRFDFKLLKDYELRIKAKVLTYSLTFSNLGDNTAGLNNSNYSKYIESITLPNGDKVLDISQISGGTELTVKFKPILDAFGKEDKTAIHRLNINNNQVEVNEKYEAKFIVSKNTTVDYGISYLAKIKIGDIESSKYIEEIIPSIKDMHFEGTTVYVYIKPEYASKIKAVYYTSDKTKKAEYDKNAQCYTFSLVKNTVISITLK